MDKLNDKLKGVSNKTPQKRKQYLSIFLILPALALILLTIGYPISQMIYLSFRDYNLLMRPKTLLRFIGITNYVYAITNQNFRHSVVITLVYALLVTSIGYIIGLLSALLLNSLQIKAKGFFNLSVCLPWAIPGAIIAYVFLLLFQSPGGIISYWISKIGLDVNWFTQILPSLYLIVIATVWGGFPFITIGLLAGLQSIPNELYEAALIDGASTFKKFFYITLPALNSITAVLLILTVSSAFRSFSIIWILTAGGPLRFTETLGINLYKEAFSNFNFGYASSMGVITLLINMLIIFIYIRLMKKEFY